MTPRLSIIAASIRCIGQAPTAESSDQYWDNVVLAMRMDVVGDSDPYWSNTVLAMHMDGTDGSTTFTDEKGKAIKAVGNCSISTAESKFGGSSAYFDGAGDALTIPNSQAAPVLAFGSGDFTIEGWILPLTMPYSTGYLVGFGKAAVFSTGIHVSLSNTGVLRVGLNGSSTFTTSGHSSLIGNGWRHFAVVRSGNTVTAYIDGVSRGGTSFTGTLEATGDPYYIGSDSWYASNCYKGHLDDLRITKGVARYTSNFTPPTSAFEPLLTSFIDLKGHTVTYNGGATLQTTTKKYGSGAAYFDGAGDYLSIPNSTDFDISTGDFTIEWWGNPLSTTVNPLLGTRSGTSGWLVGCGLSGANYEVNWQQWSASGGTFQTTNAAASASGWAHFAIVKKSGVITCYINGVGGTPLTPSAFGFTSQPLQIGQDVGAPGVGYNGYIDDLRITKGIARYTTNFTPPTAPLSILP